MVVGRQPLSIEVHGLHVDLKLNGKVLVHSEEYSTLSHANRAALTLREAILRRPLRVRIMHWTGLQWVRQEWTHFTDRDGL